jgi:APA family basic amino acid/polyamine antiporter
VSDLSPVEPNTEAGASASGGLRRQVGLGTAVAIIVASMIGQGIFTTTGYIGHELQSPYWVLALWTVGGVLALAGALSYAELATRLPRSGGEYAYIRAAFGPLPGFLSGWSCLIAGFSAPITLSALVCVEYAAAFFHDLHPKTGLQIALPAGGSVPLCNVVAAALIASITAVHMARVSSGLRLQEVLTAMKGAIILLLAAGAVLSGKADATGLVASGDGPQGGELAARLTTGLILVLLAYAGWNGATYVAAEVKDPRRTIPRATVAATIAVTLLYLAVNVVYLLAVPVTRMKPETTVAVDAAEAYFGLPGKQAMSAVIALTQLATISVFILTGSRIYYAMAEDGVAPRRLARLAGESRTPREAVFFQGLVSIVMALWTDFFSLAQYAGAVLSAFTGLALASLLVLRRRQGASVPGAYRAPFGPLLPAGFLLVTAVILGFFVWQKLRDSPMDLLVALASLAAGLPVYWACSRAAQKAARPATESINSAGSAPGGASRDPRSPPR